MSWQARRGLRLLACGGLLLAVACGGGDGTGPIPNPQPAPVAAVIVTPSGDTVIAADSILLVATPKDSSGQALAGRAVSWSTSNASVASVSAAGLVRGLALGQASITASVEGRSASASVTVAPVITVAPDLPSLFAGDTLQLRTVLTDATGAALSGGAAVTWTSGVPATAGVSASGIVSGVAAGTATVTANVVGATGAVDVVVLSPSARTNREIGYLNTDTTGFPDPNQVWMVRPSDSSSTALTASLVSISAFAWSRDGSQLAVSYLANDQTSQPKSGVWVQNAVGGNEHQLHVAGTSPTWAPDGSRVAFVVSVNGDLELYSNNTAGSDLRRLTNLIGNDYQPAWSPDGRRLVFVRNGTQLWVMRADGTGARLSVSSVNGVAGPRWSPDGKRIAFFGGYLPSVSTYGVWVVNADGSGLAAVSANCTGTTCVSGSGAPEALPTWSRDARFLYYPTPTAQIARVRLDGLVRQTFPGGCGTSVDVSPDGQWLAFSCQDAAQSPSWWSVFVMSESGSGLTSLTRGPGVSSSGPSWRP